MKNKKGLVMGVANQKSIAWGIAEVLSSEGASLALTYQGDNFKKKSRAIGKKYRLKSYIRC
jgi:enoyl-[acyl-carrier protein] reductase I